MSNGVYAGLVAAIGVIAGSTTSLHAQQGATVGLLEIDGPIAARQSSLGFGGVSGETTLKDVLKALDKVRTSPAHKGLVIRLKDAEIAGAQIDELAAAIRQVRAAGKKVHLYAEGYSTSELLLGAACDEVILQQGGAVMLPGLYMEEMFLADTFKWVGVTPDFVQVGDYKGASEQFANAKPSPAWDQNINSLLDAMYAGVRDRLKTGRKLDDAALDKAMEAAWMADGRQAKAARLIDSELDLPDLSAHIAKAVGTTADQLQWDDSVLPDPAEAARKKMGGNPFALLGELFKEQAYKPKRATIAVVHIDGAIVDGESTSGGLFGGEGNVGSRTIKRTLEDLREDPLIKGVVLRIDSPGGSAIASEMMWQSIQRLRKEKPVFVSVGSMAASGGYYLLVAGERVYVNPSSIVGSIGVVGGKMALGGVYDKLKVNVVARARGPRAALMASSAAPWSEAERGLVRQKMTETYELFTSRVSAGRPGIDLSKTAEGRLFVGQQAVDLKMADRVGGLQDATTDLAEKLGLADGGYDTMDYPAPKSFAEAIEDMVGGFSAASPGKNVRINGSVVGRELRSLVASIVGEANASQIGRSMEAMFQLRKEPVILVSPRVLMIND